MYLFVLFSRLARRTGPEAFPAQFGRTHKVRQQIDSEPTGKTEQNRPGRRRRRSRAKTNYCKRSKMRENLRSYVICVSKNNNYNNLVLNSPSVVKQNLRILLRFIFKFSKKNKTFLHHFATTSKQKVKLLNI